MPTLEGTNFNSDVIRMYFPFRVSNMEMDNRDLTQFYMRRGVVEICGNCVSNGYYILGLESAELEINTPMLSSYSEGSFDSLARAPKDYREVGVSLYLRVRRFANKLTTDEMYEWTRQFSERVLFEIQQLQQRSAYNAPFIGSEISPAFITDAKMNVLKVTEGKLIGIDLSVDTGAAVKVREAERKRQEEARNKPKLYNIIRRPKLCSSPSS